MMALGHEDTDNQNRLANQGGLQPLVRLLRSPKTLPRVLLIVIKTLGTLCVGKCRSPVSVCEKLPRCGSQIIVDVSCL